MDPFAVLPWELGRECLLRVPYHSHENVKAVCKTWEAVVKHPQFYEDRKKLGTSEQLICLLELREYLDDTHPNLQMVVSVFDPLRGTRKTLPPIPHFPGSHNGIPLFPDCVCVNQKLVLFGVWDPSNPDQVEGLKTVFIFDFSSSKWSRGADMPVRRFSGAFSVSSQGLIYVAGGQDGNYNLLSSAAVYNVLEDEWKLLPDMSQGRDECYGAFLHGKFFVISSDSDEEGDLIGWSAEVYDPERGAWSTLENMSDIEGKSPRECLVVSSSGRLYSFEKQQGVAEYDSDENVWRVLGSLPKTLDRISCCIALRDKIFVYGYRERNVKVCYMYEPPPVRTATEKQAETIGMWTTIERSENSYLLNGQSVDRAVTFEI